MNQLEAALAVIAELNRRGHEAFLVGGCVRDLLIGRTPKDYDVTTHATPQQVMAIFPKTVPVGVSFGVVTVVMDGVNTEVATFRADGEYSDARHPDCVHYSETAEEDVVRRDFTMNGLLIRLQTPEEEAFEIGQEPPKSLTEPHVSFALMPLPGLYSTVVVDFVGGRKDINDKVIRAIGNPEKRFTEDALRMLRACRFAAQLGFAIEAETMTAMQKLAPTIKKVSEERISAELLKIVSSPNPVAGLVPLAISGLLDHMQISPVKPGMVNILRRFSMFPTDDPAKGMAMLLCELVSHPRFMLEKKMKLPLRRAMPFAGRWMFVSGCLPAESDFPFPGYPSASGSCAPPELSLEWRSTGRTSCSGATSSPSRSTGRESRRGSRPRHRQTTSASGSSA